jgi:hypothetical protein
MSISFDKSESESVVRSAAAQADSGQFDQAWFKKVKRLSRLCEGGASKTHIAFLGTAMIAKAMRVDVDLLAIKPKHALDNPRAYSARILSEKVLVPLAAELGVSIGVTGRQPLNNQPYFRMTRLGDQTPVHPSGRAAFDYMVELVKELQAVSTTREARAALAAFIVERRRHQVRYDVVPEGESAITPEGLAAAVRALVRDGSEGGRRAQAVVAGLMDAFAGPERVESGRINDPSRKYPGDVCVRAVAATDSWEKSFEIRDKPVAMSDVKIFGAKCAEMEVQEAAVVAVADDQAPLDTAELAEWSSEMGIGMTLFDNWESIVDQALFWAGDPKPVAARRAVRHIHKRLIGVEASESTVALWAQLTSPAAEPNSATSGVSQE